MTVTGEQVDYSITMEACDWLEYITLLGDIAAQVRKLIWTRL